MESLYFMDVIIIFTLIDFNICLGIYISTHVKKAVTEIMEKLWKELSD